MTFLRGSVAILAWAVMLTCGLAAGAVLLSGDVFQAVVFAVVAWGAWKVLEATT